MVSSGGINTIYQRPIVFPFGLFKEYLTFFIPDGIFQYHPKIMMG
jgi:hypothetical protein